METIRKTKLEILEETKNFYTEDPTRRATSDNGCRYLTDDGRMCAVGRCLIPNSQLNVCYLYNDNFKSATEAINVSVNNIKNLEEILKEEYRGHSKGFWSLLQSFHDREEHWSASGLTVEGKEFYQDLCRILEKSSCHYS